MAVTSDVLSAILFVEEDQPGLVSDVLLDVFQHSACVHIINAGNEAPPNCGTCSMCRFILAVENVNDGTDTADTDPDETRVTDGEGVMYLEPVVMVPLTHVAVEEATIRSQPLPRECLRQIAFNLVADEEDWRNPIATTLDETVMAEAGVSIDDVRDAIEWRFGSTPSIIKLDAATWFVKAGGISG